jgi:hypothetical protein
MKAIDEVMRRDATLLRVFGNFERAQQAHAALLAAGLPADALMLRAPEDDGGPVAGNFVVDLAPLPTPAPDDPRRQTTQAELRTPVQRGTYLLTVEPEDEAQARLAEGVLARFGDTDAGERLADGGAA